MAKITKTTRAILGTSALALAGAAMLLSAVSAEARGKEHGKGHARPSFEQLDLNGDGQITRAELAGQAAIRFDAADANKDGELDRSELLAMGREGAERHVERMLKRGDTDENGTLSQAEMEAMHAKRSKGDRAARMFERADANGDDAISAEEFAALKDHHRAKGERGDKSE